ncbi:hypothetical protein [uncultured Cardiobacterium sp.]|uniref:hypothetical protein n=1 Tax=uncultured Cardiobacterium sp. TaxID=417619 RepID=UPI002631256C|nr:hypothetical protein [uncultured Cardiobacterium sp.]
MSQASESPKIYHMPMAGEYLHDLLSTVDPAFRPEEILILTAARIDALSAEAQEKLLALVGESVGEVATLISNERQTLAICREDRLQLQGITKALGQRKEHLKNAIEASLPDLLDDEPFEQFLRKMEEDPEHVFPQLTQSIKNEWGDLSELSDDFNKRAAAYLRIEQQKEEDLLDLQQHFRQLKWLLFVLKTHQRRMQPDYQGTEEESLLSLSIPLPTEPFTCEDS